MSEQKKAWEVHPLRVRIEEEVKEVSKMPEQTDIEKEVKRIRLDALKRKVEQAQELELDETIEEKRANIQELRESRKKRMAQPENAEPQRAPSDLGLSEAEAKLLEKMTPEERSKTMESLLLLKSSTRGSEGFLLPLLAMSRAKPEMTTQDLVSTMREIMALGKEMQAKEGGTGAVNITEVFKEALAAAKEISKRGEGQVADPLQTLTQVLDLTEKMKNAFGPGQQGPPSGPNYGDWKKWELEQKKLELEAEREEKKIGIEEKKLGVLADMGKRLGRVMGTAMAKGEDEALMEGAEETPEAKPRHKGGAGSPEAKLKQFNCESCGSTISVPIPTPKVIACAKCKATYDWTPSQG